MVDPDVVTSKLAELRTRLERIAARCPDRTEELTRDVDALDIISFNLMLAVQASLDAASHVIADEGWVPARTLSEAFRRLEEHGVITRQTADALSDAAGLRNVVAHGYAGADVAKIHRAATEGRRDLERFAQELARWLTQKQD
jgi:uncharacterized protein YutE (UPF0331/DUF86 family)